MEFSKHNWATISETSCPEMLIFGKWASWTLFFQNILTNLIISEILFLWRHHFSTLWRWDQKHWPVRPRNVFSSTNIGTEAHVPTRYWPRCNPKGPSTHRDHVAVTSVSSQVTMMLLGLRGSRRPKRPPKYPGQLLWTFVNEVFLLLSCCCGPRQERMS